jgi:EAL and modified HD-GYP domain-containing signal transduction protein
MTTAFLAAQPVFDRQGELFGHEYLYRDSSQNRAVVTNNMKATSQVLFNALHAFKAEASSCDHKVFINVDHEMLHSPICKTMPADRFILEILEDTQVDDALLKRVELLRKKGYKLAIDDFDLSDVHFSRFTPLFPLVDIVKVDLLEVRDFSTIKERLARLQKQGLTLLAEKIDNIDTFAYCKYLGFSYFQGYYLCAPKMQESQKITADRQFCIHAINMIRNKDQGINAVALKLKNNPRMAANFLKYLHTSGFCLKKKINSLPHGVRMLGPRRMTGWLLLNLYTSQNSDWMTDRFSKLAVQRSVMMESCAGLCGMGSEEKETAHLIGLVSLLDIVLKMPYEKIFGEIALDEEIRASVLEKKGILGTVLRGVLVMERGKKARLKPLLGKLEIHQDKLDHFTF